ncbi:MAG TPA: hypothetical protein VLH77_01410, partial [Gammaproteobacteria bacterium]|nr:hypothetical protein [Gammaproteobacteria bacterium]
EALNVNRQINVLKVSGNALKNRGGAEGTTILANWLKKTNWITHLECADNFIGGRGATAFAELISVNNYITHYDLSENMLCCAGTEILSRAIAENDAISHVDLSNNFIRDNGAMAFAEAVSKNHSISQILLAQNNIGDLGARSIADAIAINPNIEAIYLGGGELGSNRIGDVGALAIFQTMHVHKSVHTLDLSGNSLTPAIFNRIYDLLVNQGIRDSTDVVKRLDYHFLKRMNFDNISFNSGLDKIAYLFTNENSCRVNKRYPLKLENFDFNVDPRNNPSSAALLKAVLNAPSTRNLPQIRHNFSFDETQRLLHDVLMRVELELQTLENAMIPHQYPACPTKAHSVNLSLTLHDLFSRILSVHYSLPEYQKSISYSEDPAVIQRAVYQDLRVQFSDNASFISLFMPELFSYKQRLLKENAERCTILQSRLDANTLSIRSKLDETSKKHSAYKLFLEDWLENKPSLENSYKNLYDPGTVELIEDMAEGQKSETHTRKNLLWSYLYGQSAVHKKKMAEQKAIEGPSPPGRALPLPAPLSN